MPLRHACLPLTLALALAACSAKEPAKHQPAEPPPTGASTAAQPAPRGEHLPTLAANAPKDQLVETSAKHDQRIQELSAEAMQSYPAARARYFKGLPAGEHFFLITTLTSPGKRESVFVAVSRIQDGKVTGTIASEIASVAGYKSGDAYTFPEREISDWLITKPDGSEEGNLVGKYLDTLH